MSPITLKEKKLAIVLLDIIGSTAFVQKYGAQKAAEWFQYHDRMTRNLCYKFKGREIDRSDGFLMSFDTTIDAVNFALHYQKTIPQKTRLDTRIGIHWGKVIEVQQDELYALMGAKGVELEGIGKNIAARTMSICGPKQVLLTKEAFSVIKNRTNHWTPKGTRYVMVGLYKFKGVAETQVIYAVGESIESLQPPEGNEKAKRLGGPKKVKSKLRDKKIKELMLWILPKLAMISLFYIICITWPFISNSESKKLWGVDYLFLKPFEYLDVIRDFIVETSKPLISKIKDVI